LCLFL